MDAQVPHDGGCPGMWRLVGATVNPDTGAVTEYVCELCEGLLVVPPGGTHPETV